MSRSDDHHLNGADVKGSNGGVAVAGYRSNGSSTRYIWAAVMAGVAVCFLVVARVSAGRAAHERRDRPRIIYRSREAFITVVNVPPHARQEVYIAELHGPRATGNGVEFQNNCLRLDAETGKVRRLADVTSRWPLYPAFANGGRVAIDNTPLPGSPSWETIIEVWEPGSGWRAITRPDGRARLGPRWSPDGASLIYTASEHGGEAPARVSLVVAGVPPPGELAEEREIIGLTSLEVTLSWDAGGEYVLCNTEGPDHRRELIMVELPAGRRMTLLTAPVIGFVTVAETSRDVAWVASQDGKPPLTVWRLRPGGRPEATRTRLSAAPSETVLSPDGKELAIVSAAHDRVILCDLNTGRKRQLVGLTGQKVKALQWALEGSALVFTDDHNVWLAPARSS